MQPCNREMPGMNNNSLNPSSQISLQELQQQRNSQSQINQHQIQSSHFESPMSHDYFLEQMLTNLGSGPSSWAEQLNSSNKSPWDTSIPINGLSHHHNSNNNDNNQPRDLSYETVPYDHENVAFPYDESSNLASKFRDHQINGCSKSSAAAADALMLHQQLVMSRGISGDSEHGVISMPLSLNRNGDFDLSQNDVVDGSSFKSPSRGSDGAVQSLNNGFGISLHGASQVSPTQTEHFHHPKGNSMQAQSYRGPGAMTNQAQPPATGSLSGATAPSQTRPRVRARRGQATDPHSIAERLRRERIAERMKALQELVPNANKTDKASMLDEIIDYVKFLQVQVKVLSMSRLGGAAAVAPYLGADMSSKGGGDCIQTNGNGGTKSSNNQAASLSNNNESMTVTEHQVAKLMEDDMGSAMQYLQGKGLCLMPIYLATAISTAMCHARSSMINNSAMHSHGEGSPSISGLTVQSATLVNGGLRVPSETTCPCPSLDFFASRSPI